MTCLLTCGEQKEGNDWDDAHVAHGGVEGQGEDGEGNASILYGCLQGYGYDLIGRLKAVYVRNCFDLLVVFLVSTDRPAGHRLCSQAFLKY